jgi:hypothetical protein
MPDYPGKFHAIVEWIGQDPADYTPLYDLPREGGGADKVLLYRPKYFETMAMRLYLHDGRAYEPNASTTVFALRDAGGPRKLISSYRTFRTYPEAERYIAARPGQDLVLGSLNPLVSCVPLEPVPGLRLVFDSNPGEPIAVDRVPRTVKIFERVKLSTQFRKYGLAVDALPAPLRSRLWSWVRERASRDTLANRENPTGRRQWRGREPRFQRQTRPAQPQLRPRAGQAQAEGGLGWKGVVEPEAATPA